MVKTKLKIIFISAVLMTSCGEEKTENNETNAPEENVEGSVTEVEVDTLTAEQHYKNCSYTSRLSMVEIETSDTSFTIPVGEEHSLTFSTQDVELVGPSRYEFKGINTNNDFYVLDVHYWEWYESQLVDRKTGVIDTLWTHPIFSPNDSLLISKSVDFGLEGTPNGFQVWTMDRYRNWTMVYEIDQQEWVPLGFCWISNEEFVVKKRSLEDYKGDYKNINDNAYFERIKLDDLY